MPNPSPAPQSRPPGAPAYYLARLANWYFAREWAHRRAGWLNSRCP